MFSLKGRVALITGGSRGMGRSIAIGFAAAGAKVVMIARDEAKLESVAAEIRAQGGEADYIALELSDLPAVERAVPELLERHGRLDILVNAAGVSAWSPLATSTVEQWHEVFDINLTSMYVLCREASKPMVEQGWGRIINFASNVSVQGRERLAAYSASKAAVGGLTRSVAGELATKGVTCNGISPGVFRTDMSLPTMGHPERSKIFRGAIAMDRFGEPEEIVGPALFLASDASSYVTGHMLAVDGGMTNILTLPVVVET